MISDRPGAPCPRAHGAVAPLAPARRGGEARRLPRDPDGVWDRIARDHAELRELIDALRRTAERARGGEPLRKELAAGALRLANALREHNNREEQWLRSTAEGSVSDWLEATNERHFEEHRALHAALRELYLDPDDRWVAGKILAALDAVLDHMAHEEGAFDDAAGISA